ncbi:hypothetical protein ABFS82_02G090500 [Erythranthe guttata]|uniref:Pentacotripeptide-repeat region of PRORP domain-containing protein n=1 Tax=Erythranthe guttata TaxID=4155 RepID=A0A022RVQ7_ERYGU|nr:PREDICTED: pentatricopeptide repeat-containing protein At1g62350-like [Erythranthe guttata]EYU44046.1 hypothetical protein MIMGU_mgv1a012703mg [Erythranthe guttata]|eukprot:XP_012858254.1 PREDICTED: pentatricopeptide repeat-containing protein At1g62350-like [Erythranthe guttata]
MTGMYCIGNFTGLVNLKQMNSSEHHQKSRRTMSMITMRDRSKNRKPLQKGRNLSIEAIQTVQALKRASRDASSLEQVYDNKFRRLLKFDMIAVLRELLRQNQCLLALKVFEDVRKEEWYKPKLLLIAEMVTVLGSNGLLQEAELVIAQLKAESCLLNPDLEGFNALLQSLMNLNLTGLAIECFYLMKSVSCDPDRLSFKILIDGLEANKEIDILAVIQQDAHRYYGQYADFLEMDLTLPKCN